MTCAVVARDAGTMGNPVLQVGGEQAAVTVADPGREGLIVHDSVQLVPTDSTLGLEELQTKGILPRIIPPLVLGRELFPMTSVIVATMVWDVAFEIEKAV